MLGIASPVSKTIPNGRSCWWGSSWDHGGLGDFSRVTRARNPLKSHLHLPPQGQFPGFLGASSPPGEAASLLPVAPSPPLENLGKPRNSAPKVFFPS